MALVFAFRPWPSLSASRMASALVLCVCLLPTARADDDAVQLQVRDPRAFGHLVGDTVSRELVLDVPRRLSLKQEALPVPGRINSAIELSAVDHASMPTLSGTRHWLRLDYQVFLAPREPRVLDLPSFTLKFDGKPRPEELRVDDAALGVVPMLALDPSPRTGFGVLRPDAAPLAVDTGPERTRLLVYGLLALWPLGYLAMIHLGWPWWQRRQRPFARAEREMQRLPIDAPAPRWLAAWRTLHAALGASAGRVLSADALDRFIAEHPRFASLRGDLATFFGRSQQLFFVGEDLAAADKAWLRSFCRRCFDVERGAA